MLYASLACRLNHTTLVAVAIGLLSARCAADPATDVELASADLDGPSGTPAGPRDQAGWDALVHWDAIPTLQRSTTRLFTSTERPESGIWFPYDAGNKDFNNFIAICGLRPATAYQYVDDSGYRCNPWEQGYLLAAADGPGFISRIMLGVGTLDLFAQNESGIPVQARPTTERIRIYIDDSRVPAYEGTWLDWYQGGRAPFQEPLSGYSSGIGYNYVPISYARNVRVFADGLSPLLTTYYYQVTTHTTEKTAPFDAAELTSAAAQADLGELERAAREVAGAETWFDGSVTLSDSSAQSVWERDLAGTVKRLTIAVDSASAAQTLSQIVLRLYWEADSKPALEIALAELFGQRQGISEFETWPMRARNVEGRLELTLTLPMPFRSHAKLELANTAEAQQNLVRVRVEGVSATPSEPWGRLHTSRRTASRPRAGDRFLVAELTGAGKYVGMMMYMVGGPYPFGLVPGPHELNFLEGDDRVEVDGVISNGTGTEETFNGGWYFSDGPYNGVLSALIRMKREPSQGEITAVRWTVLSDSLSFRDHFHLSYEYGANHPEAAFEYVAVGFYYQ